MIEISIVILVSPFTINKLLTMIFGCVVRKIIFLRICVCVYVCVGGCVCKNKL